MLYSTMPNLTLALVFLAGVLFAVGVAYFFRKTRYVNKHRDALLIYLTLLVSLGVLKVFGLGGVPIPFLGEQLDTASTVFLFGSCLFGLFNVFARYW